MGEAKRRKRAGTYPKEHRGKHGKYRNSTGREMWLSTKSWLPADIKTHIGQYIIYQNDKIDYAKPDPGIDLDKMLNGTACLGLALLRWLGLEPTVKLGGIMYRAGPDPERDTFILCGPGNVGRMIGDHFLGQIRFELKDEIIDFTCCEWHRWSEYQQKKQQKQQRTQVLVDPNNAGRGGLAKGLAFRRNRWRHEPPSLIWSKAEAFTWQPTGVPEPDEVWYCPWQGPPPSWWSELEPSMARFVPNTKILVDRLALPERIHDAVNDPAGYAAKWGPRFGRATTAVGPV
jgi:hypothetical protein